MRLVSPFSSSTPQALPSFEQDLLYAAGGMDLCAFFTGYFGEGLWDLREPAHDVKDAVRMLGIRDHGEEAGTVPGRHAEVL